MPAALLSARVGADADKSDGGEAETVPAWRAALDALRAATVPEEDSEARDAEARVCAAKAIAGVTRELLSALIAERRSLASSESNDSDLRAVVATVASEAMEAMLACAEDYCVDNRGDVGSWVREAAMEALPSVVAAAQASAPGASAGDSSAIPSSAAVVAALLKQASEKIDRVRAAAFAALVPLLRGDATRTPRAPRAPRYDPRARGDTRGDAPRRRPRRRVGGSRLCVREAGSADRSRVGGGGAARDVSLGAGGGRRRPPPEASGTASEKPPEERSPPRCVRRRNSRRR